MPSRITKPPTKPKLKTFELSDKQAKKEAQANRNKMPVYGDVPDLRPKGRIYPPSKIPVKLTTKKI